MEGFNVSLKSLELAAWLYFGLQGILATFHWGFCCVHAYFKISCKTDLEDHQVKET